MSAETPEKKMEILEGSPVEVILFGEKVTLKRMSISKQRKALSVIQGLAAGENQDPVEKTLDLMVKLIAVAADIDEKKLNEESEMAEIAEAFKVVWKQNRFDFLLKTIADLGAELTGSQAPKV